MQCWKIVATPLTSTLCIPLNILSMIFLLYYKIELDFGPRTKLILVTYSASTKNKQKKLDLGGTCFWG
jgi:hypothetical protein